MSLSELEEDSDSEWITKKSHMYKLKGIVIHVGTADR